MGFVRCAPPSRSPLRRLSERDIDKVGLCWKGGGSAGKKMQKEKCFALIMGSVAPREMRLLAQEPSSCASPLCSTQEGREKRERPGWKEKEDARHVSPDRLPLIRAGVLRPSGMAFLGWNCPSPFASNHLLNMCTKIRGLRIRISIYQRKTMFNPSDLSPPFRFFISGHKNTAYLSCRD